MRKCPCLYIEERHSLISHQECRAESEQWVLAGFPSLLPLVILPFKSFNYIYLLIYSFMVCVHVWVGVHSVVLSVGS